MVFKFSYNINIHSLDGGFESYGEYDFPNPVHIGEIIALQFGEDEYTVDSIVHTPEMTPELHLKEVDWLEGE